MPKPKSFRYSLNQKIRRAVKWMMRLITTRSKGKRLELHKEKIDRILLVRATFRMGDSVLATPAIFLFRKRFPGAKIDFVGAPISKKLFQNIPIDEHFCITRRFPDSSWTYLALLNRLRSAKYDLAVDLSCSQSALGAFIVGFSKARFRVGLRGEWDRWFNVRIPRPPVKNKYKVLPAFLSAFGLEADEGLPAIGLTASEREEGRNRIESTTRRRSRPVVGVFIGGRQTWSKRWPIENFYQLITVLHWQGTNVVTFFGPEEKRLMERFGDALEPEIPLIYEPSPRKFAGLVASCDLFITCDSGPMHLAYAVDTRIIAIFQNQNFDHWGPPSSIARIVHEPGGCSVEAVLKACELEMPSYLASVPDFSAEHTSLLTTSPKINRVVRTIEK